MAAARNERRRAELRETILQLSTQAIAGTASETFRTCGNPGCRCHHGGPKHGPHMYVSYRRDGRQRGYYVPARAAPNITEGIEAWHRLQKALTDLADLNRDEALARALAEKKPT
jgi:hypothetical protein